MILITGAAGFLGTKLVSKLSESFPRVVPLYRKETFQVKQNYWEADLTSKKHISQLKWQKEVPDTVIHLAGRIDIQLLRNNENHEAPPYPNNKMITDLYLANVIATANILEYCLEERVKHLIFASSQSVYGFREDNVLHEELPLQPLEHYAASKACAEQLLKIGSKQGVAISCLRIPGLYSEERKSGVVYHFCKSAFDTKNIEVTTHFPLPLDVIHIDDVIEAIKLAIIHGGKKWTCLNIATGEPCSVNILAKNISKLVKGCQVKYSKVKQPTILMKSKKAKELLGWEAVPSKVRFKSILESIEDDG